MAEACANCGEILRGPYCHGCGQKRMADGDRRLGHLLGQLFAAATDLDGRFWRSLRALLFQPGRLSRDYLDGRRRHWLAPMTLFLLANVLYFLSPGTLTDFNLPLSDQMSQVHSRITNPWVMQRIAERDRALQARRAALPEARRDAAPARYTLADYARDYGAQAGNVGKALIIVHIPFLAVGLALMFRRRRLYFAEHAVVATHLFTFTLLYIQLVMLPLGWLLDRMGRIEGPIAFWLVMATLALMGLHYARAVRRVYAPPGWLSLLAPVLLITVMMLGNLYLYRTLQFLVTFWLT